MAVSIAVDGLEERFPEQRDCVFSRDDEGRVTLDNLEWPEVIFVADAVLEPDEHGVLPLEGVHFDLDAGELQVDVDNAGAVYQLEAWGNHRAAFRYMVGWRGL